MTRSILSLAALCLLASIATAQPVAEKLPDGAKVVKLVARPETVTFTTSLNYSQLLITAHLEGGDTIDVTRIAKIELPAKLVSMSTAGLVRPLANGKGEIAISLGGKSLRLPVEVSGTTEDTPVGFVRDVQPVLGKLGCNGGTCHGAQSANLLPPSVDEPRVSIEKQNLLVGCRYTDGWLSTVFNVTLEPYLTEHKNEIAIRVRTARAGSFPIPLRRLIDNVTQAAHKAKIELRWQQVDGDPIAIFEIPPPVESKPQFELESLELNEGRLSITGRTLAKDAK